MIMNANNVIPENLLLSVNFDKFNNVNEEHDQSQSNIRRAVTCDWSRTSFIESNFSKLTDSNQIFRNDFVCITYHICEFQLK